MEAILLTNVADVILTGYSLEDKFGNSVSTAGDVNGDGYDDVIVAAYFNDAARNRCRKSLYLFWWKQYE